MFNIGRSRAMASAMNASKVRPAKLDFASTANATVQNVNANSSASNSSRSLPPSDSPALPNNDEP